ncbi:MAG TPA: protein kinase [Gemmatimonadaceae bacterium]|nr:protein kinase [Gemmatimonadaceae bacterium]
MRSPDAERLEPGSVMTPERWLQVKGVMHEALDRAPADRAAFLEGVCAGDDALRREVESLLQSNDRATSTDFLDEPPPLVRSLASAERANETSLIAQLSAALGDKFTVERELGGGGMSRVFLAYDHALGRQVAVKVLNQELAHRVSAERFKREILVAAGLQHPNIVPVHSAHEVGGLACYTMPYAGESLRERLSAEGVLSVAGAVSILRDVAKALAFAHSKGVVHRDIKPENVLITGGTAQVTDFGVAKAISVARTDASAPSLTGENITSEGIALGTPGYMSPEQATADPEVGPRADVYSFGVVAYELLAGVRPFSGKGNFVAVMASQLLEVPRPVAEVRREVPPGLAALVMRCLAIEPSLRFADGAELLVGLEQAELGSLGAVAYAPALADMPSIAVLPLENLSAPENDSFSDGIAAEVQSVLAHMRGIRVAARNSSFAFKGQNVARQTIAESLGVLHLLVGNVRRSATKVRIAVRLLRAVDDEELWKAQYDRELADIFAVQEEIAQSIALALENTLATGERHGEAIAGTTRSRPAPVNQEAFELYLRGRQLVEKRKDGMQEALRCFEEAARLDPDFSPSYAGMAYALVLFGIYHAQRPREAFPRALLAAEQALALDPNDVLALVMRAHVALWYEWNFEHAEAVARQALDLAPGFYLAHDCLGFVLAAQGRFEEATAAMEQARSLDPLTEDATYDLAWILIMAGRWEQALRTLEPAVARHPQASELHRAFGFCLLYTGRAQEARAEFARVLELNAGDRWATPNLVQPLVALGEITEATSLLAEIERRAEHEPMSTVGIAIAHHCLGQNDLAITWLERAIEERYYWLVMLRFDPSMAGLRYDPRFQSLMNRVRAETAGVS